MNDVKKKTEKELAPTWRRTTEDEFDEMLGAVPPARFEGRAFMCGEAMTHGARGAIHRIYIKVGDFYYARLGYLGNFNPGSYEDQIHILLASGGISE